MTSEQLISIELTKDEAEQLLAEISANGDGDEVETPVFDAFYEMLCGFVDGEQEVESETEV